MVGSWAGPPAMLNIFQKMFSSHSCPSIIRQNNFSNLQHYFIQKTIPVAMAQLRNVHNICPAEVHKFLLDLFKYNDNSRNKFSDNYYRAALIESMAATVTPAVTTVSVTGSVPSTDALTADTKDILEEVIRYLNLEKLLPSYRFTVTVSCLRAIRRLQRFGHLPSDSTVFKSYAIEGNFSDVRVAALEALVDFTAAEASANVTSSEETLFWLLNVVEQDADPFIRCELVHMLCANLPFTVRDVSCPLCTNCLVDRLWTLMNSTFAHDSRLRCGIADLYFLLFGRNRPSCLPLPDSVMLLNLKEGRTVLNTTLMSAHNIQDVGQGAGAEDVDLSRPSAVSQYFYSSIEQNPLSSIAHSADELSASNVDLLWSLPADQRSVFSEDVHRFLSGAPDPMRVAYEVTVSNENEEMQLSEDSSASSSSSPRHHDNTAHHAFGIDDVEDVGLPTADTSSPQLQYEQPSLHHSSHLQSAAAAVADLSSFNKPSSPSASSSDADFDVV
jgi:hypothetical protein